MYPQLTHFAVYRNLTNSKAFMRLAGIAFLGAIDRLTARGLATGTRFDHSISVAYLAYLGSLHLDKSEQQTAIAAALLHDIGHGPLSHSTESYFRKNYNIDHRTEGRRILLQDNEIRKVLRSNEIDIDRVENLAFGKKEDRLSFLFHHTINIDTIEGITRCARSIGKEDLPDYKELVQLLVTPDSESQAAGDWFWKLKHFVYNNFILSHSSVAYDAICLLALERVKVDLADFRLSDEMFLNKFKPSIDHVFERFVQQAENKPDAFEMLGSRQRGFIIEDGVDVHEPNDVAMRYR